MRWSHKGILGVGLSLFILFSGCDNDTIGNKSLINVLLIDAPGDFDEVWIEILGVEVLPSGSRGLDNANWINIPYLSASNTVRVSDLVADEMLLLGRREIQSGTISKVKLLLGETFYLISDEEQVPLFPVGNLENYLELDVDIRIEPGISYDLYLDFNLAESVMENAAGGYQLKPSLRSFVRQGTAEISGTIAPNAIKPHVYAISVADTFATLTNNSGTFRLRGLPPVDFRVWIDAPQGLMDTTFTVSTQPDTLVQLPNIILNRDIPENFPDND